MAKVIVIVLVIAAVVAAAVFLVFSGSSSSTNGAFVPYKVERGNVVEKAMAIGQIEPKQEIVVKSQISGIVSRVYVDVGDRVRVGDPLFDISPQPTPLEYADATRQVELAEVDFANASKVYERVRGLFEKNLAPQSELDDAVRTYEQADVRLKSARERVSLIEKGKTDIAGRVVENVIRSSISGTVLKRNVDQGDPVVPLTSYQAGTELMVLAEMENLIFRGTVDEIDVGKLSPDMAVHLQIGAIPNDTVEGVLRRISPMARRQDNTTVFDVEAEITAIGGGILRAGYSANAEIIITEKRDVLVIPERLVTFAGDSSFVDVKDSLGEISRIPVEVGFSDGISIEVVSGLEEGQDIIEKPPRSIE